MALLLWCSHPASAQSDAGARLLNDAATKSQIIHRLVVLESLGNESAPVTERTDIDPSLLAGGSLFSLTAAGNMALTLQFNPTLLSADAPSSRRLQVIGDIAKQAYKASGILIAPEEGPWSIYSLAGSNPTKIASAAAPDLEEDEAFKEWLGTVVGYSGVVVGVRNGMLLVAGDRRLLRKGAQAITVRDSANQAVLKTDNLEAESIIQLVRKQGNLGLFKQILGAPIDVQRMPIGTKVIIQQ